MGLVIAVDNPRAPDVGALLSAHLTFARSLSPPEHVHALEVEGLLDPAVTFFSAREDGGLLGVGALKRLDDGHGELKSMHVDTAGRRRGVGRYLVAHLVAEARHRGYLRLSLETGTEDGFAPARALYRGAGFVTCEPFAAYTVNPHSVCMTLPLVVAPSAQHSGADLAVGQQSVDGVRTPGPPRGG